MLLTFGPREQIAAIGLSPRIYSRSESLRHPVGSVANAVPIDPSNKRQVLTP